MAVTDLKEGRTLEELATLPNRMVERPCRGRVPAAARGRFGPFDRDTREHPREQFVVSASELEKDVCSFHSRRRR
jgi:hypothetical protein